MNPDRATEPVDRSARDHLLRFAGLRVGERFADRYEIVRSLGAGGSGVVFEAGDTVARARVALKVLFPIGQAEVKPLERLRREVAILRDLRHQGIVRVYDIGEWNGLLYMVMELLSGESLKSRISRSGRLSLEVVVALLDQLLEILVATHGSGVVHRDIKPANIFLKSDGDDESVVLLDFGLARHKLDHTLTSSGALLGTLEYMAPEQVTGRPATPQSDLYSVGILSWEMLSGSPPYGGESGLGVAEAHRRRPLPDARIALPGVPVWLRDLLTWLLQKEPRARAGSARQVLDLVRGRRRVPLLRRWAGRMRTRSGQLKAGALVVLAIGLIASVAIAWRHPAEVLAFDDTIVVKNLLGVRLASYRGAGRITGVLAIEPHDAVPGDHVIAGNRVVDIGLDSGLQYFESSTGRLSPFIVRGATLYDFRQVFPFFASRYSPTPPVELGIDRRSGERLFLVQYECGGQYPVQVVVFDRFGNASTVFHHAGRLWHRVWQLPPRSNGGQTVVVACGVNNVVSQRGVVFGFSLLGQGVGTASIATPPFEVGRGGQARPVYYTFLPEYSSHGGLMQDGVLTVWLSSGRDFRIDAYSGCPVEERDRDGISCEQWIASQAKLLEVMEASTAEMQGGRPVEAAERVVRFLDATVLDRTQRGVLWERTALLYQIGGRFAEGQALCAAAIAGEPGVPGHYRRWVDLTVRSGGVPLSVLDAVASAPAGVRTSYELNRDLFLAFLLTGRYEEAWTMGPVFEPFGVATDYYSVFFKALEAIHKGQLDRTALLVVPKVAYADSHFNFLHALALCLKPSADIPGAYAALERSEVDRGSGNDVPFEALRAYLDALSGESTSEDEILLAALQRHAESAKRDIVNLYYAGWASILARTARPHLTARIDEIVEEPAWARSWPSRSALDRHAPDVRAAQR